MSRKESNEELTVPSVDVWANDTTGSQRVFVEDRVLRFWLEIVSSEIQHEGIVRQLQRIAHLIVIQSGVSAGDGRLSTRHLLILNAVILLSIGVRRQTRRAGQMGRR